jgi:hypothetical protein
LCDGTGKLTGTSCGFEQWRDWWEDLRAGQCRHLCIVTCVVSAALDQDIKLIKLTVPLGDRDLSNVDAKFEEFMTA